MAESKRTDQSSRAANRPAGTESATSPAHAEDHTPKSSVEGASGTFPASVAGTASDLTGRTLGDFCLLRRLGKGGMAEVYLAEQTSLRRQVAIKIMRPDFVTDPQYVKRFRHEASAAGGLNHPNIVQVYMVGEQDGIHFISQEYVQGRNLKEFITRKGPMEVPIALHVLKQVAAALQVAHEKGIVHRDIKPENILLTRKGEAKVADFGLAQLTLSGERVALTQTGITMGTPLYMSPEQVNGKTLDARSDIYSLGVMAWHMLVGHPPFTGDTALAVAVKHLNEAPPSLADARPDVPAGVRVLIEKMMAKRREDRPADAQTVLNEIKQLLRQVTSKESPTVDATAFRPRRPAAVPLRTILLRRPLRKQLGWLIGACILMAASSAGIGWARRLPDPFLIPATTQSRVQTYETVEGQFYHAQGNPTDEAAWYEALAKLKSATDSAHVRMRDQCELNLAMIYLHGSQSDQKRRELARTTFSEFAGSTDLWKRANGAAGLAIIEDLQRETADRNMIRRQAEQAESLIRQIGPEARLDPVIETALRDVVRRSENRPK